MQHLQRIRRRLYQTTPTPHYVQCDQMAIIFFQYLPIFNNENLPNSTTKHSLTQVQELSNLAKYSIIIQKVTKDFQNFANVAKFRQIWSLCSCYTFLCILLQG